MSDYMQEVERLIDVYLKTIAGPVEFGTRIRKSKDARSALLAHIERRVPDGWRLVPSEFVTGFTTLAHNYSLRVDPPEHYLGTEADAFRYAYARCGRDLAELRSMLAAAPSAPVEPTFGIDIGGQDETCITDRPAVPADGL